MTDAFRKSLSKQQAEKTINTNNCDQKTKLKIINENSVFSSFRFTAILKAPAIKRDARSARTLPMRSVCVIQVRPSLS